MSKTCDTREQVSTLESLIELAKNQFKEHFNLEATCCGYAPGRVNLIGDHVDYNDGFVLPMAISLYTVVVGTKSNDDFCTIKTFSTEIVEASEITFSVTKNLAADDIRWANYVKGVIAHFPGELVGFKAAIVTSIPLGAGLSSSAALEVSFLEFLDSLSSNEIQLSLKEKAILCQQAEHTFAKVPCGLMDQIISLMGKEKNALLINCRSMDATQIPLQDPSIVFLVTNSKVRHELGTSEYIIRKKACDEVASMLARSSLRDVSMSELETSASVLRFELYQYARHVLTEIDRTLNAAEALKRNDYKTFGTLMTQSHYSLRDDYKVSCPEIDELVEIALKAQCVYGTRMTGGGFGGCTVTLVQADQVNSLIEQMKNDCKLSKPEFYVFSPVNGSKHIRFTNVNHDLQV